MLGGDWPSVAMDVTMSANPPDKGGGAFVAFKELQNLQAKQRAARSASAPRRLERAREDRGCVFLHVSHDCASDGATNERVDPRAP